MFERIKLKWNTNYVRKNNSKRSSEIANGAGAIKYLSSKANSIWIILHNHLFKTDDWLLFLRPCLEDLSWANYLDQVLAIFVLIYNKLVPDVIKNLWGITTLSWDKALRLVKRRHVTWTNQSECFISRYGRRATLEFVYEIGYSNKFASFLDVSSFCRR